MRTRLRRLRTISLSVGALLALVILGTVSFTSFQPRFQIVNIDIRGERAIPEQALLASVHTAISNNPGILFSEKSMVFFPAQSITESLTAAFPRIEQVAVSVDSYDGQAIAVDVKERAPYARWCRQDGCYLIDANGFIFAPYENDALVRDEIFSGGLLAGDPIGTRYLPTYFKYAVEMVDAVELLDLRVKEFKVVNDQEYHIVLTGGAALRMHFSDEVETITESLSAIITAEVLARRINEVAYIDLRFNGRAYYKFK